MTTAIEAIVAISVLTTVRDVSTNKLARCAAGKDESQGNAKCLDFSALFYQQEGQKREESQTGATVGHADRRQGGEATSIDDSPSLDWAILGISDWIGGGDPAPSQRSRMKTTAAAAIKRTPYAPVPYCQPKATVAEAMAAGTTTLPRSPVKL